MTNLYAGDNGTTLSITVSDDKGAVNLLTTSSVIAHFVRPDKTTFDKTLSLTDGALGKCSASLASTDLTVAGVYAFQVNVTFSDGKRFSGDVQNLIVDPKL